MFPDELIYIVENYAKYLKYQHYVSSIANMTPKSSHWYNFYKDEHKSSYYDGQCFSIAIHNDLLGNSFTIDTNYFEDENHFFFLLYAIPRDSKKSDRLSYQEIKHIIMKFSVNEIIEYYLHVY